MIVLFTAPKYVCTLYNLWILFYFLSTTSKATAAVRESLVGGLERVKGLSFEWHGTKMSYFLIYQNRTDARYVVCKEEKNVNNRKSMQ